MRTGLITFIFIFLNIAGRYSARANTITLEEAIKRNLVSVSIAGRGNSDDGQSSYYGKCIKLSVRSRTSQNLEVQIEAGRILKCIYDSVQDMVVIKSELLTIKAWDQKEVSMYAMCSQKHDQSPSATSVFSYGSMAEEQLIKLTRFIEQNESFNRTGQYAVWCITDDEDMETITGDDAEEVMKLKSFVSALKNEIANRDENFIYDYSFPTVENGKFKIEGDFEWEMTYGGNATLAVYNSQNKLIASIFINLYYDRGLQRYHYAISDPAFKSGEMYWLRLVANNKKIKEVAVTMD